MKYKKIILRIIPFFIILLYFWLGKTIDKFIFLIVVTCSILFGLFLYHMPLKAFDMQRKFYAHINWKIEPISLTKEIRNTKIMGLFLLFFSLAAGFYFIFGVYFFK